MRVSSFLFLLESLLPPLGGPSYKLGSGVVVLLVVVLLGVVCGLTGRVTWEDIVSIFWSRAFLVPLVRHNCTQLWSLEFSLVEASVPCTLENTTTLTRFQNCISRVDKGEFLRKGFRNPSHRKILLKGRVPRYHGWYPRQWRKKYKYEVWR